MPLAACLPGVTLVLRSENTSQSSIGKTGVASLPLRGAASEESGQSSI